MYLRTEGERGVVFRPKDKMKETLGWRLGWVSRRCDNVKGSGEWFGLDPPLSSSAGGQAFPHRVCVCVEPLGSMCVPGGLRHRSTRQTDCPGSHGVGIRLGDGPPPIA